MMDVSFDYDGVVMEDRSQSFLEFLEKVKGVTGAGERYRATYCWNTTTGVTDDIARGRLYAEFKASSYYTPSLPMPGAKNSLLYLKGCGYPLHLATARPPDVQAETVAELEHHSLHVLFESYNFGGSERKPHQIKARAVRIHVDDNLKEAKAILELGTLVILFPHPLNCEYPPVPGLHYPPITRQIRPDMPAAEWQRVWAVAWGQVAYLIDDLLRVQSRRRVSTRCG
jgi:hypothetical protein